MKPEFIEINTKDGLTLPGLFYEKKNNKKALIFLHGNGSSSIFYNEKINQIYAGELQKENIAMLYFNNRGAHIIKKIYSRKGKKEVKGSYGMAYEKIKECIHDIDGAVDFLKKRGYKEIYLGGASTGANKICVYNFYKIKNEISKYVLLCGGDDTGIYYDYLGKSKYWKILKQAKNKIKNKQGEEIAKELLPNFIFSYKGFWDIANPDGDYNIFPFYEVLNKVKLSTKPLLRHFKSIKKPSLVVYGDLDEYAWGDVPKIIEILKEKNPVPEYKILKGADHGFKNKEKDLAKIIASWLSKQTVF